MTVKKYVALSFIDNDKSLSLVKKYEVLLSMNKDKTSSFVDKYETLSSLNKDKMSSSINNDTHANRRFAITELSLDNHSAEKTMAKLSSAFTSSQKRNQGRRRRHRVQRTHLNITKEAFYKKDNISATIKNL